jgi:hypothetical protein
VASKPVAWSICGFGSGAAMLRRLDHHILFSKSYAIVGKQQLK